MPELSVDNELSQITGPQCLDMITFTCNLLNSTDPFFDWYANDVLLARYTYRVGDMFPFDIVPDEMINATVVMSSVNMFKTLHSYYNYTLSVNLRDLLPFQGQNISCGTTRERSTPFPVNNFEVVGELSTFILLHHVPIIMLVTFNFPALNGVILTQI